MIRGGRAGYERLQVLARERRADTHALFARAGVGPGMRCVDLGCGGGEVSFDIAERVAPGGTVTGIDMDVTKIGLARDAASARGMDNVEFLSLNVNDWSPQDTCDVVYCRFLLQHLNHPADLLRRMWAAVRRGGAIVVEDADFDGWCCDPPNDGFDFFVSKYRDVIAARGGDHALGRKLRRLFAEVGIPEPEVQLRQAVHTADEGKILALSTLEATCEAMLAEGVASAEDIEAALASLERHTSDQTTLICGPRIFQLWARR